MNFSIEWQVFLNIVFSMSKQLYKWYSSLNTFPDRCTTKPSVLKLQSLRIKTYLNFKDGIFFRHPIFLEQTRCFLFRRPTSQTMVCRLFIRFSYTRLYVRTKLDFQAILIYYVLSLLYLLSVCVYLPDDRCEE